MKLFEYDSRTGLERLTANADIRYETCLEMQAIWSAVGEELDEIRRGMIRALAACFIHTADEEALAQYEAFLKMPYGGDLPIDERRALVAAYFMRIPHIGEKEILELLGLYSPDKGEVDFEKGTVYITLYGSITDRKRFMKALRVKLPGHLGLFFTVIQVITMPEHVVPLGTHGMTIFITEPVEKEHPYDYEHGTAYAGATGGFYGVNELPEVEPDFRFGYGAAVGVRSAEIFTIDMPDLTPANWEV